MPRHNHKYDVHGERRGEVGFDDVDLPSEHDIKDRLSAELQVAYDAEDSLEISSKYTPRMHAEREAWRRDQHMAMEILGDMLGPSDVHIQDRVDRKMTHLGSGFGWPGIPLQAARWRRAAAVLRECLDPKQASRIAALVEDAIDEQYRTAGK